VILDARGGGWSHVTVFSPLKPFPYEVLKTRSQKPFKRAKQKPVLKTGLNSSDDASHRMLVAACPAAVLSLPHKMQAVTFGRRYQPRGNKLISFVV